MIVLDWGLRPAVAGARVTTVGDLPADAVLAIGALRGEVVEAIGWDAIPDVVCVSGLIVAGVPADIGHGELERLADLIRGGDQGALVVCEVDALDAAWSVLGDTDADLLCDAEAGDWAAALALAAYRTGKAPGGRASGGVREDGDASDRLRQLHDEVVRIAALLAGLAERVQTDAAAVDERRRGFAAQPPAAVAIDAGEVRAAIRARRMRAQFFDARLLEDPGWDMLLDLFAAELENRRVSVSSLCIAAAVAPTTALRWISRMVEAGLMARVADPGDRRRAFVALSDTAAAAMRGYVAAAKRAGLGLV